MKNLNAFLFLFFAVFSGTLIASWAGTGDGENKATPFPHKVHAENDLECVDCHEGALESAAAGMPTGETCFDCHDDPEIYGPAEKAFFEERAASEGKLTFFTSLNIEDLKFSHVSHGELGAECIDCHGDVLAGETVCAGTPDFKYTCYDCHTMMEASLACSVCHDTFRKENPPVDHGSALFKKAHGAGVKSYYRKLPEGRCFFCHEADSCDRCHRENRPDDHGSPFFRKHHGDLVRCDQQTMADANCSVCHDERSCDACHQQREPLSHSVSFKNKTHGLMARMERQSCKTCHQQSFCVHCHTSVEPLSHRGQFDRGQQNHCYSCHLPLSSNRCSVCHTQTVGHTILPLPSDATHLGVTANSCRVCHAPVPHADNGLSCLLCH